MAFALAAALLAGCQSNPEPPPFESASDDPATPTATASPADAAPTLPPEAKGTSEASAKAFVRHYIDTVNYAMRTGRTSALRQLSDAKCSTCEAMAARIDEVYGGDGRLEGEGWEVTSLSTVGAARASTAKIAAGIKISPQIVYSSESSPPSESPGSRGNLDFSLTRNADHWIVGSLEATQ